MIRSNALVRSSLAIAAVTLLLSACDDDPKRTVTAPVEVETPAPAVGSIAYLTISDEAPKAGSTVTVTAHATGTDRVFGSFAAHLTHAPGLTYVGEAASASGMRAVNAKAGDIAVAGVNLEGFADGALFSVELRVVDPAALATLALSVSELTGVDYRNERASLSVQKAVRLARAR